MLDCLGFCRINMTRTVGAGAESRTPITSLENWDNNRYTTPANGGNYSTLQIKERPFEFL